MRWAGLLRPNITRLLTPGDRHTFVQCYRWNVHFFTMSSKQQPEWLEPTNSIEEPVLKVYNSLTHTKARFGGLSFQKMYSRHVASVLEHRRPSYHNRVDTSSGITAVRLYMMPRIWAMPGKPEFSQVLPTTLIRGTCLGTMSPKTSSDAL